MLSRAIGWLLCRMGLHRWWREDGFDFGGMLSPQMNEEMRCVCVRPDCNEIHLSTTDRAEVVGVKFRVIEGGGMSTGALSVAYLRVLPPPCPELDELLEEVCAGPPNRGR